MMIRYTLVIAMTTILSIAISHDAVSQSAKAVPEPLEFRIDTDVYLDQAKPPIASTKTLFLMDRIVDWDEDNRSMMSIDLSSQQIELSDFSSQRRCRIDMRELSAKLITLRSQLTPEQVQAWSSSSGPIDENGTMSLASGNLRYRFKTIQPRNPEMAALYAEFANWSIQVSAVYPPFKPPLLRLQLNDYLAEQKCLPTEVQLTDLRSASNEPMVARLLVQESLTKQDRERLKDWDVLVATLKLVSDSEFFQSKRLANDRKSSPK
jgi:hypothetical protein